MQPGDLVQLAPGLESAMASRHDLTLPQDRRERTVQVQRGEIMMVVEATPALKTRSPGKPLGDDVLVLLKDQLLYIREGFISIMHKDM